MRWLVTGGGGMLAQDLVRALRHHDVVAPTRAELDITDDAAVHRALSDVDIVVNTAAFTAVDAAESDEAAATAINATAAGTLARAAQDRGVRVVQLSTDYVFDGRSREPYDERAAVSPINAYGRSKVAGERAVMDATGGSALIVRTAWLYGGARPSFGRTILRKLRDGEQVAVVTDQVGQPTWTADLAARIVEFAELDPDGGIYHATNSEHTSWFEFARAIAGEAGLDTGKVVPTSSTEFVRPAPRPEWSVLGQAATTRLGLQVLRPWREALSEAIDKGALDD